MNSLDLTFLLEKTLPSLSEYDLAEIKRIESLDVTKFSESDVREEIINQLLRILDYKKGQDYSVKRETNIQFCKSKNKKKEKTDRFLDYSLTLWEKDFWIIEAKKPRIEQEQFYYEDLVQVIEYAIHPEINAALVVLCDGVKIEVFDREHDIKNPLLRISIKNLTKEFDKLRNLLCPLQVWFFYKRRVIKAIDRAFEHDVNARRINEFKEIIEYRLNEKRCRVWDNLSKIRLDDSAYINNILKAETDEIIDIQFFTATSSDAKEAIVKNLLSKCTNNITTFDIISKIFPEEPREANEIFYCHALAILINMEEQKINVNHLPKWLTENSDNIHNAICSLIKLCLTNFQDDLERKIIILATITYRRVFKILAIILPNIRQLANMQHLITRYSIPEFCLEQLLSCPERNIINNINRLSIFATSNFVSKFSIENKNFDKYLARQYLQELWQLEITLLRDVPNYLQLRSAFKNFGEVSSIESYGVIYDNLGHRCLCFIESNEKWKSYIFYNHYNEIEFLANMGSCSAKELLNKETIMLSTENNIQPLAERFFFGDINVFNKIASAYGFEKYGYSFN